MIFRFQTRIRAQHFGPVAPARATGGSAPRRSERAREVFADPLRARMCNPRRCARGSRGSGDSAVGVRSRPLLVVSVDLANERIDIHNEPVIAGPTPAAMHDTDTQPALVKLADMAKGDRARTSQR